MTLIGLDIGTTSCKAHVFNETLDLLYSASREYAVDIPFPKWAEQDAELVWSKIKEVLQECVREAGISNTVKAIGLSVQGEAVVPVDVNGLALRPMILGMDTRTDAQNEWLKDRFGAQELFKRTGMPIHTINTLPKLLWLKEHEPKIWKKAHKFLLYEDFIINKLTHQPIISQCLASRTQLYDLIEEEWSSTILDALELDINRLSPVVPSGTVAEKVDAKVAQEIGIFSNPIVVCGGHDQACGALGAGLIKPGLAMVSTGSAEVVEVAMDSPHLNDVLFKGNMSVYHHTVKGLFVVMTLNQSGGYILRWFRDTFCDFEKELVEKKGGNVYDLLLKNSPQVPSHVMILPHFSGSGTPHFDTSSKGAIVGLTFATNKNDIAKAIIEGLTMELRLNLELLQNGGISINELRAIGGGAKSDLWLQLKADITHIPVAKPKVTEAAGEGAAILAGVAAGIFSDAASAIQTHMYIDKVFHPNPEMKERYDERYDVYKNLYPSLKTINQNL